VANHEVADEAAGRKAEKSVEGPTRGIEPAATPKVRPEFDATTLLKGSGKLTPSEAVAALVAFRDTVITPASENCEPEPSLLRSAMIEALIKQRVSTLFSGTLTSHNSYGRIVRLPGQGRGGS
jgi:hypothetical protein